MRASESEYLTITNMLYAKYAGNANQARCQMTQDYVSELYHTDSTTQTQFNISSLNTYTAPWYERPTNVYLQISVGK